MMTEVRARWALFAALAVFAPCGYFVLFIVGLLPMPFLLMTAFAGPAVFFVHLFHAAFHAGLFYALATLAARAVFRLENPGARNAILAVAVTVVAAASAFPIYGATHDKMVWKTWYGMMAEAPSWLRPR